MDGHANDRRPPAFHRQHLTGRIPRRGRAQRAPGSAGLAPGSPREPGRRRAAGAAPPPAPASLLTGNCPRSIQARASAASRSSGGPPAMHQPSFNCGSPTVFDKPPSVNDSTVAPRRDIRHRADRLERIVGKHLVRDQRPAARATNDRHFSSSSARTNEPVGLLGETTSSARTSAARATDRPDVDRPPAVVLEVSRVRGDPFERASDVRTADSWAAGRARASPGSHSSLNSHAYASLVLAVRTTWSGSTCDAAALLIRGNRRARRGQAERVRLVAAAHRDRRATRAAAQDTEFRTGSDSIPSGRRWARSPARSSASARVTALASACGGTRREITRRSVRRATCRYRAATRNDP